MFRKGPTETLCREVKGWAATLTIHELDAASCRHELGTGSACYFFAFTLDMGLKGLPIGLACGGLSSLILNTLRFGYLAHRDKKEGLH